MRVPLDPTGSITLAEALLRYHAATALVRRPAAFPPKAHLSIIIGTPLFQADIAEAFDSASRSAPIKVVKFMSTLTIGQTSDKPWTKPSATAYFHGKLDSQHVACGDTTQRSRQSSVLALGSSRKGSGMIFGSTAWL